MFDEFHLLPEYDASQDSNQYYCGVVADHNVIMATLPVEYSDYHHAGHLSSALLDPFSSVRTVLIVGIGGGVSLPKPCENPLEDVHLRDVVVG